MEKVTPTAEEILEFAQSVRRVLSANVVTIPLLTLETLADQLLQWKSGEWCSTCDKPQWAGPDGSHQCATIPELQTMVALLAPDGPAHPESFTQEDRAYILATHDFTPERRLLDAFDTQQCKVVELANVISALTSALRYYRDECSGAEPSISVFQRRLDEALKLAQDRGL